MNTRKDPKLAPYSKFAANNRRWSSTLAAIGLFAALATGAGGCSAIQVNGKPLFGSGGSAMGGLTPASSRIKETYEKFDHTECKLMSGASCANAFRKSAGIEMGSGGGSGTLYNPRANMENLDPKWLVGWESLPTNPNYNTSNGVYGAIALAAVRRSWSKSCPESYDATYQKLYKEKDASIAAKIAEAKKLPTVHGRIQALINLRKEFTPHVQSYLDELKNAVGPRYEVEKAIAAEFRENGLGQVYTGSHLAPKQVSPKLRPRMSRDEEAEAFCAKAAQGNIDGIVGVDRKQNEAVRNVYPKAKLDALEEKVASLRQKANETLSMDETEGPELTYGRTEPIESIEREGGVLVVTTKKVEDKTQNYNCKTTNKVERVAADGTVYYHKSCKYDSWKVATTTHYTLPKLPEDIDLQKGDKLTVYWKTTSDKQTPEKNDKIPHKDVERVVKVEVSYVAEVVRGAKKSANFVQAK